MDTVDKTCTGVPQDDLVSSREGLIDFQDGGTTEPGQEEGEVIGYFELDPSAGLQLMQGENTIYLPPEALGEHVLMSDGSKGCQQIIVVVEEGTEGTVAGLASDSAEIAFGDGCENAFVGDGISVQQNLSPDLETQSEHEHQQVLVLQGENTAVTGVHEAMLSMLSESSANSDEAVLVYPEVPDGLVKPGAPVGNGVEMAGQEPEPVGLEKEQEEHLTVKFAAADKDGFLDGTECRNTFEDSTLDSNSNRESHHGTDLPSSDVARLSSEQLSADHRTERKVPAELDTTVPMPGSFCDDMHGEDLSGPQGCDVADRIFKDRDNINELVPASAEEYPDSKAAVLDTVTHHDICGRSKGHAHGLTSSEENQDDSVNEVQDVARGEENESSLTNYMSEEEDSITKSAPQQHTDCSSAVSVAEPSLNTLNTYIREENLLCSFPYTSISSLLTQGEQPFSVKDSSSFSASLLLDYPPEKGQGIPKEQKDGTYKIPDTSGSFKADEKDSEEQHDHKLGNSEMREQSQEEEVHQGVEEGDNDLDDSLHTTEPAKPNEAFQYSCKTLRSLSKEAVDRHTAPREMSDIATVINHAEDMSHPSRMNSFSESEPQKCSFSHDEDGEHGSGTAVVERSTEADLKNFTEANNTAVSQSCNNSTTYAPDTGGASDVESDPLDTGTPEGGISQSEVVYDRNRQTEEDDPLSGMRHVETSAGPCDVSHPHKAPTEDETFVRAEVEDRKEDPVVYSENSCPLPDSDEINSTSQKRPQCQQRDLQALTSDSASDIQICRNEKLGDTNGNYQPLNVQTDGLTCDSQLVGDSESQLSPTGTERIVGEELMAALDLVPCQEQPAPSTTGDLAPEEKMMESVTQTPPKVPRKKRRKSEAQASSTEGPSSGQKRWCLRTPTTPRKRLIIPDSDEDDFDSYETFDTPQQTQKTKGEEAFDALLSMFKMEQAKKASETPSSPGTKKMGSAKHRRALVKKESVKQTLPSENKTVVSYSKVSTSNAEPSPTSPATSKPIRKPKVLQKKPSIPRKSPATSSTPPKRSTPAGDIRIRCQRPTSTPEKSTPQYHCSKCGFRSARMDNIVRHHKEECPHTKTYFRWGHDVLKRVSTLGSDYHVS